MAFPGLFLGLVLDRRVVGCREGLQEVHLLAEGAELALGDLRHGLRAGDPGAVLRHLGVEELLQLGHELAGGHHGGARAGELREVAEELVGDVGLVDRLDEAVQSSAVAQLIAYRQRSALSFCHGWLTRTGRHALVPHPAHAYVRDLLHASVSTVRAPLVLPAPVVH